MGRKGIRREVPGSKKETGLTDALRPTRLSKWKRAGHLLRREDNRKEWVRCGSWTEDWRSVDRATSLAVWWPAASAPGRTGPSRFGPLTTYPSPLTRTTPATV
ncbi:unnamed protein product [Nezara viridula]|uniref:Uncharacterized protein n=1 Tax=Nezara viridula TaxID=85310 RepID=A0A9P0HB52_NEZVI|nr:unnamed protein product [Nezara viridula]